MADEIARLGIEINSKDIKTAIARLDKLEKEAGQSEKATKKLSGSFKGLGAAIGAVGIGLFAKKIISATIEQEKAIAQVESAIESTGMAAGLTSEELQDMASSMQQVTTFGDEAVLSMQSVLLTFTKVGQETFPRASEVILDVATRMGTDLKSAALQVGKALNDPIKGLDGLSRSGIQFTDEQKDVIKSLAETGRVAEAQSLILNELETQFGGAARAARQTFGGAIEALGNAFGDLLEEDGDGLKGATGAIESLTTLLGSPETKAAFGSITSGIVKLVELAAKGAVNFAKFGEALGTFASELIAGPIEKEATQALVILREQEELVQSLSGTIGQYRDNLEKLRGDPGATQEQIQNFEGLIEAQDKVLEREQRRLDLIRGINEETTSQAVADIADSPAVEAKRVEIDAIHEMELDAMLEAAIREEEELTRIAEHQRKITEIKEEEARKQHEVAVKNSAFAIRLAESGNKKATEVLKGYLLDQAKMLGQTAVVGAYKWGAAIGGPIAGAAAAGAASLAVGAIIDAIGSSGGSEASPAAGGGSTVGDGGGIAQAPQGLEQEQQKTVSLADLDPDLAFSPRTMIEIMNRVSDDGVRYELA